MSRAYNLLPRRNWSLVCASPATKGGAPSANSGAEVICYLASIGRHELATIKKDLATLRRAVQGRRPPIPIVGAHDARWSIISRPDDAGAGATDALVTVLLGAASAAMTIDLSDLEGRCDTQTLAWVRRWPGEHYRLFAALTQTLRPTVVIEVGTFKGYGALALAAGYPQVHVITYDLIPWESIDGTVLRSHDFEWIE